MHPGVVVSGIGSLFKPSPESPGLKPQIPAENGGPMTPVLAISDRPSTSAVNPTSPTPINAQSPAASGYFGSATMSGSTSPETATTYTTMSSLASPVNDPNYNPPFPNDVRLPARKGWENTLHFIMKHSDGLTKATKSYVTSHFEFGGCLADYPGLKYRYTRLRGLEDVDELHPKANQAHVDLWRVRFVNYYTASTGRLKQANKVSPYGPHTGSQQFNASHSSMEQEMKDMTITTTSTRSPSRSPRISVEEHRDNEVIPIPLQDPEFYLPGSNHERLSSEDEASNVKTHMSNMDPRPVTDDEAQDTNGAPEGKDRISSELNADQTQGSPITFTATDASVQSLQPSMSLPPVPPEPSEPSPFDPSPYNDKAVRKLAEKDHSRQMKAYRQAIKDRDKAVRDRQKLLEKREKNARLAREKQVKLEEKQRLKDEKEESKRQVTLNPEAAPSKLKKPPPGTESGSTAVAEEKAIKAEKAKRDRKFCTLPPKNPDGSRDPCWVRIYMEGVDEVGAHVGLFIAQNPHYEKLVGDVGARIEEWVREAADVREVRKRLRVKGGGGGAREGFAAFWAGEEE
ncbi:hypothetical protein MMC24_004255 [Lignoscripta atroalba]|nr:hypothetical protein [Lignoscripta atroalba]